MYKIVDAKDMGYVMDSAMEGIKREDVPSFVKALVLEREKQGDDPEYMSCEILKVYEENESATYGNVPAFGDYMSFYLPVTGIIKDEKDFTENELKEAKDLKREFDEYHRSAPYKIRGSFYDKEPVFEAWDKERRYPRYKSVEEVTFSCPSFVNSLDKAELWLLNNYPEYYMGCTISQDCRGGNFLASAVPCPEYPKGKYETYEGRIDYAADKAKELYDKIPKEERDSFSKDIGPIRHDEKGRKLDESELTMYQKMYWASRKAKAHNQIEPHSKEKSLEAKIPGKQRPEHHLDKNYVIIWQRDPKDEFSFVSAGRLKERGIEIKRDDFTPVYVYSGARVSDLDDIYDMFQNDTPGTPEGYSSRSLSVGDVVTVNKEGKDESYLVDTFGFKKVPEFTNGLYLVNGVVHDKASLTRLEADIYEDQYGMDIDGNEKIGKDALASDIGDRDRNGNGIADKYDRTTDDDDDFVR